MGRHSNIFKSSNDGRSLNKRICTKRMSGTEVDAAPSDVLMASVPPLKDFQLQTTVKSVM